ncbi:MAG: 30S ribosomal protein S2 [bacterium]|nr:30S ribosomal protein S2 [bacterium]
MSVVTIKQLLEAGVHFGHQTRRWNPKMAPYIFGERNGIHIIDLRRTLQEIERAYTFVRDLVADGGVVLFVGTKKQARTAIEEAALAARMPYVNFRWLGGMLTNFKTINQRIFYMKELAAMESSGDIEQLPKKERIRLRREYSHLLRTLGGVADMEKPPSMVFVIDLNAEHIAVREALRLEIPVIGLVDSNCNPDDIDFVIPGNDDAIRAASLIANTMAAACVEGRLQALQGDDADTAETGSAG